MASNHTDSFDIVRANKVTEAHDGRGLDIGEAGVDLRLNGSTTALAANTQFVVTNWTEDRAMDCDAAADAEICDVLGTLLSDLDDLGIVDADVSA